MLERLGIDRRVDAERRAERHVLLPVYLFGFGVDLIGIIGAERGYRHEHARGGTQADVRLVQNALVAAERHRSTTFLHIVAADGNNLFRKHIFQTFEGLCYHIKFCSHLSLFSDC